MTIAIMQPYYFPYLGYWQMFNAVDKFVLLDDVNYISRGYINRNSILVNKQPHLFTLPLEKPSINRLIKDTRLNFQSKDRSNFLRTVSLAYRRAPHFKDFYPLVEDVVNNPESDLTSYLKYSFESIKSYLGLNTEILVSSEIAKDNSLKAQDRIIEINRRLGSQKYINAIGGQKLYSPEIFSRYGIELKFIQMQNIEYRQFGNDFIPNLSIIDVMMFNSKEQTRLLLKSFTLI